MCTLNTCAVVRIQISKLSCLGKLLPLSCKLHSQKRNAVWRFSVNLVYSMPIPYCNEAHTACGMCLQLSLSYMQSLISLDSFRKPSPFIFRTYCQWQKGEWELVNMSTHWVLNVNQNPTDLWSQLRSCLRAIFCCRHALHVYLLRHCVTHNLRSPPHRQLLKFCCWHLQNMRFEV